MTTRLMNSAMMPRHGRYEFRPLSVVEFVAQIRVAHRTGDLVSYCGYQQNADLLSRLAGIPIPLSRERTVVEAGDLLLIMTLRYRTEGLPKGGRVEVDDFEFGEARYTAP